jgi:hypothetical protein
MGLFEKLQGSDDKWMWYFLTLFASFIPVILRLLVSFDLPIQGYDIKDFLFAGLAMNLSNLSLIGHKEFDRKLAIALIFVQRSNE